MMGTAFGITVDPAAGQGRTSAEVSGPVPDAVDEAFEWLRWVDRTFSTYQTDSEISGVGRGTLALDEASPEVREVLVRCAELTDQTDGWFTARPGGDDRTTLDPSAFVKGWSIDHAAVILRMAGHGRFAINGGGDIVCGAPMRQLPRWRVGIRHPTRHDAVTAVLELEDAAIATSGLYERGSHLWGRLGSDRRAGLTSVTVVGPELGTADALATAVFVEGSGAPLWFDRFPGYDRLVITEAGRVRWTSGLDGLLAGSERMPAERPPSAAGDPSQETPSPFGGTSQKPGPL